VEAKESYILIDRPDGLGPVLAAVDRTPEVAIDTEADNLFRYRTKVCLLQVHAAGQTFLVDLLAGISLDPLWERLRSRHLIMHGSDYDLRLLIEEYNFVASSVFDTMLAAQLLNRPRIGLASLLQEHFGVTLAKEGQKANWSKRPIATKLLDYAARDVVYLPRLRDLLIAELERLGRVEWLKQKCDWQIRAALAGFPKAGDHGWRIGRSETLGPRGLAVLFDLWHWREAQAERLDVPPFKVVGNELLLRLATAADEGDSVAAFESLRLGKRERLRPTLHRALQAGLRRDPASLPRRRSILPDRQPLSAEELDRQEKIRAHRDEAARRLELDPTLIASRAQLAQLAREPEKLHELLLPWQAGLLQGCPAFPGTPFGVPTNGHRAE
jgi:ribonuclease D